MSSQFAHEGQSTYKKSLAIVTEIDHLIGRPSPAAGIAAQTNQAAAELTVRIAEALGSGSSADRTRRLEHAAQMATALGALLDVLYLRGIGSEHAISAAKSQLSTLSKDLSTAAKSVAANKQLRQRVRL